MNCEKCQRPMVSLHEVVERETLFTLWECQCGTKRLDRRPAPPGSTPAPAAQPQPDRSLTASTPD